jgi:site-specific recombinase XerD
VLKQKWFDEEIIAPKKRPQLPTILSVEQITRILDCTHNLKHWTIIAAFYATSSGEFVGNWRAQCCF